MNKYLLLFIFAITPSFLMAQAVGGAVKRPVKKTQSTNTNTSSPNNKKLLHSTSSVTILKAPTAPTPVEVKERTIQDLLYFPFSCIKIKMSTKESVWKEVMDTFGNCENINIFYPGLRAGRAYDFTYRGVNIGICYYDWDEDRTWYLFFLKSEKEAAQFYNNMVKDIQNIGIPLTKDNVYGGMSNRKKPVSIFKWVYITPPVKVKEANPNIETADVVGMYEVELGVYKRRSRQ